jgi:hypothetical protein
MSRFIVATGFFLLLSVGGVQAQDRDPAQAETVRGTVSLVDWPESLPQLLREMGERAPYLLPAIDSLGLDYRYATTDSTSRWSFVLGWRPGQRVLYEGDIRPRREGPQGIRMVNVELRAEVVAGGEPIGDMVVAVDSMALRPLPSVYSFEVAVGHDRVFLDVPADEARRALRRGVRLRNLVVERMGFSAPEAPQTSRRSDRDPEARQQEPPSRRPPSVYTPRTSILVGWRIGPRPYYVDGRGDDGRTVRPRGETVGQVTGSEDAGEESRAGGKQRQETGARTGRDGEEATDAEEGARTSDSGGDARSKGKKGEDDDEDTPDLRGPALVAAGAVALTAVIGGTVGVYGTGDTPLGLAAGYTHPKGGVQLQAAVNSAVLEDASNQRLTAKALGFYDVFGAPVQPAVGLGVQVDAQRDPEVRPAVSVGLVGNLGRVVLYGGVDVAQQTPEVGLAYNIRFRGAETESDD